MKFSDIRKGLFRYQEVNSGWLVYVKDESTLLLATKKLVASHIEKIDCFTPFPVHGLDKAMGLQRSWLTLFTLLGGILGCSFSFSFMFYVDVIDWPMNIGGKPFFAWPAYIPITFELTILFSGIFTLVAFLFLSRSYKPSRPLFAPGTTQDRLCIWIGDEIDEKKIKTILGDLPHHITKVVLSD